MLNKDRWLQFGQPNEGPVFGITLHNTGNELSAKQLEEHMEVCTDHLATHFFVDDEEVRQVMPLDWSVWHTGKGYDLGNLSTIAIEICKSTCDEETYLKAQARAIELAKSLLEKFGLSKNDIFFHKEFCNVYCPHRILDIYKTKKEFIRREFK